MFRISTDLFAAVAVEHAHWEDRRPAPDSKPVRRPDLAKHIRRLNRRRTPEMAFIAPFLDEIALALERGTDAAGEPTSGALEAQMLRIHARGLVTTFVAQEGLPSGRTGGRADRIGSCRYHFPAAALFRFTGEIGILSGIRMLEWLLTILACVIVAPFAIMVDSGALPCAAPRGQATRRRG